MFMRFVSLVLLLGIFSSNGAFAAIKEYRWTHQYGMSDSLQQILVNLNRESGLNLKYSDFVVFERRDLARYRFTTYLQQFDGVPIYGAQIRTWVDLNTGHLVQMEAHLDDGFNAPMRTRRARQFAGFRSLHSVMAQMPVMKYVRQVVGQHPDDRAIRDLETRDQWDQNDLQKVITVKGRRGTHIIVVSHLSGEIVRSSYEEFPQADIPALVYPIYEESEKNKTLQRRVPVLLKYLDAYRKSATTDPYAPLRTRKYLESLIDPVIGETAEGQAAGYWSVSWLLRTAAALFDTLPWVENSYTNNGKLLVGKYATINLHPEVTVFEGINFPLVHSGRANFMWKASLVNGREEWELVPSSAYYGLPLADVSSALARPATRDPQHNPVTYINEGFDEIQVYYAINQWMESLQRMGFTDPELSTRPFHAFLYDPDISMRDNAYYTADTINFTTYSPEQQNYARDNSTIWHELGHGVMDRLMGDRIVLADTGGLSEGMADFLAQLVVQDVTGGQDFDGAQDFRIVNRTGFHLTNEVHDDGEAYGGAMKDIMDLAITTYGERGLVMVTDLTLDAMRLTRNHPGLTASGWFQHMLFADELGNGSLRRPGELRPYILQALASRNFRFDDGGVADFAITVISPSGAAKLESTGPGSRGQPIYHELKSGDEATYTLEMKVQGSDVYQFKFPVKIELSYNGGPLQGSVKWKNEEAGPLLFTLNDESDMARVEVAALPGCDKVNREDGSCVDFAYIKVFNAGDDKPVAKKRFYLRIK